MPASPSRLAVSTFVLALSAALSLVACSRGTPPTAAAAGAPPPTQVGVVKVALGAVGLVNELPGRTEASRVAQVRARVAGILQRQQFREGSDVRAGQPLFRIDDAPYRAALASAQAAQARAEANVMQTQAQAQRYKPLAEAKAISEQDYIAAQAAFKQAEADVAAAKAAVQTAQINVGYAAVTAPISGRIGRALVTEGALVGQGEATQLAVVQQIDPLFINFTQSAGDVLKLRAAIQAGQLKSAGAGAAAVRVLLEDGSLYPLPGKLLFSDLSVDATTGQITLRAEVPNPKGALLPGLFVRVQLQQAEAPSAILLPQQAVSLGDQGATVLVVGADGHYAAKAVKLGNAQAGQWVVLSGLAAGDQVIVDGFQKLRPGATVQGVPWQAGGAAPVAPAPASASASASAASR